MKYNVSNLTWLYLTQVLMKLADCKAQIMQLTNQVDNIFALLISPTQNALKEV